MYDFNMREFAHICFSDPNLAGLQLKGERLLIEPSNRQAEVRGASGSMVR